MGNQQSSAASTSASSSNATISSSSTGPPAAKPQQEKTQESKEPPRSRPASGRARTRTASYYRFFSPSVSSNSNSSAGGEIGGVGGAGGGGSQSESSSAYDYPLTPSTSLSPSISRVETQHHYDHKHGSSLDSYVTSSPSKPATAQVTAPIPISSSISSVSAVAATIVAAMGAASSAEKLPKRHPSSREKDRTDGWSPHSSPVNVPTRTKSQSKKYSEKEGRDSREDRRGTPQNDSPGFRPSGPPPTSNEYAIPTRAGRESISSVSSSYAATQPTYAHPPRLPLPISEEGHTGDFDNYQGTHHLPLDPEEDAVIGDLGDLTRGGGLVTNRSILSDMTGADEEEFDVDDLHHMDGNAPGAEPIDYHLPGSNNADGSSMRRRTVPTQIVWRGRGEKIYVTGTFANWSKKFRMQYSSDHADLAAVVLDLVPGTHHVRFIVDGEMQLSNDLPTAVDYTNTLVNYIEVSPDSAYRPDADNHSATDDSGAVTPGEKSGGARLGDLSMPGQGLTDSHNRGPGSARSTGGSGDISKTPSELAAFAEQTKTKGPELMELGPRHYGQVIPGYLSDLDRDERTARFARASARVAEMAPPPTLPGFLVRSVLNMQTPLKDDSSVLIMPNHTMLNHLATSSIRQGVLATSLTTRYKRKYVTWIMYRPTSLDE